MLKHLHEIRDPIHVFVRLDSYERTVVDSRPFQRLRHIHQLGMSSLVYPGATHKRFEHSLGVMELAGRTFDIVTDPSRVTDQIKELLPEINNVDEKGYWRRVLRMAALCHDIGHLPFSHAAEKELLPDNKTHEDLTLQLILSEEMSELWDKMTPPLRPADIAKLAVGQKKAKGESFTDWQAVLSEIIVGDAFGVDRIDYLLRDSYHAGVSYGRFDHHRLLDTLRILPGSPTGGDASTAEPTLGIELGGLHSAEALALARYFMYSQVYFHPVRRAYDLHLKEFMKAWLPDGLYPADLDGHLAMTDNEVWSAISNATTLSSSGCAVHAARIVNRDHFRVLYRRDPNDIKKNPRACKLVHESAVRKFGEEKVAYDSFVPGSGGLEFPVLMPDDRIASSVSVSETLQKIPVAKFEYVFINRSLIEEANKWLSEERENIIQQISVEEDK